MTMSFQAKLVKQNPKSVVYFVTATANGKPAWYYVQVEEPKHAAFLKQIETGKLDLAQYGKILFSGWGYEAPEPIAALVQEEYAA